MFQSKKKKMQSYLDSISPDKKTTFDTLVADYRSGNLKEDMQKLDVSKVDIHIDWLPDYKCITIQGVHNRNYLDLQIEPTQFSVGYDPDEPDDHREYPLESKQQLFDVLKEVFAQ